MIYIYLICLADFFNVVLHPHCSFKPFQFRLLMAFTTCIGGIGFCSPEFLLICVMFRLIYRAAEGERGEGARASD